MEQCGPAGRRRLVSICVQVCGRSEDRDFDPSTGDCNRGPDASLSRLQSILLARDDDGAAEKCVEEVKTGSVRPGVGPRSLEHG